MVHQNDLQKGFKPLRQAKPKAPVGRPELVLLLAICSPLRGNYPRQKFNKSGGVNYVPF